MNDINANSFDLDAITLAHGAHEERSNAVCVMEAVAWLANEPHSDSPRCACPVISSFLRTWNDGLDDLARSALLKPLIPKLIGTRSTSDVEKQRAFMALDWLVRVATPTFLDLVEVTKSHGDALRALEPIVDLATAKKAGPVVCAACSAAYSAACSAVGSAARSAACSAAVSATYSVVGSAACSAAGSAAGSAAYSAAYSAMKPTVEMLQKSALDLIDRMIAVQP